MKEFNIVTIFPRIFESYFNESIIKRAREKRLIKFSVINLRDFASDKRKTVDDAPFGGGAGMIMKVEPIYRAVQSVENDKLSKQDGMEIRTTRTILFSARGKRYTQADARRLSRFDNLILICGRYEGVDERVAKHIADEEISVGDYVLTGGEIPAMILVDSISRLIPGVLGNPQSLDEESFSIGVRLRRASADAQFSSEIYNFEKIGEYPQYTRPENFNNWKVPEVLLSGNHKEIEKWREDNSQSIARINKQ
jgi:tRNA (guanine37-N1)-methyltransferase